jgi:iron complex outermembrane receptor protein
MVYWRRKKDHFLLKRNNPAFYENYHLTDAFGGQFIFSYSKKNYAVWTGLDIRYEHIYSNNIGIESIHPKRVRGTDSAWYTRQYGCTNYRLFHEEDIQLGKLGITAGIMVNWNSGFDDHPAIIPGLDISYSVSEELTLFSSVNRALHLPTFTDLFYVDPANQGNLNLDPNTMVSLEGGMKFGKEDFKCAATGFFTSGRGMTDWLWSYKINKFGPVNLTRHNTWGIASNLTVYPRRWIRKAGFTMINAHYMYLDTRKALPDSVSKYYNLKHKFSMVIRQNLTNALSLLWNISYQDRQGETIGFQPDAGYFSIDNQPFWLVDGTIIYNILKLQVFFGISNVLNTRYIEAGSVIQPGRCWEAGMVVRFE